MSAKPPPSVRREESMRRHPAGKGRIEYLIAEAQDRQAMDVANSARVEAELHAGGPLTCLQVDEPPVRSTASGWDLVTAIVGVVGLYMLVMAATVICELIGGWPL